MGRSFWFGCVNWGPSWESILRIAECNLNELPFEIDLVDIILCGASSLQGRRPLHPPHLPEPYNILQWIVPVHRKGACGPSHFNHWVMTHAAALCGSRCPYNQIEVLSIPYHSLLCPPSVVTNAVGPHSKPLVRRVAILERTWRVLLPKRALDFLSLEMRKTMRLPVWSAHIMTQLWTTTKKHLQRPIRKSCYRNFTLHKS